MRGNPNEAAALKRAGGFFFLRGKIDALSQLRLACRPLLPGSTARPGEFVTGSWRGGRQALCTSPADNWHFENALRQLDRMSVYGDDSSVTIEADDGMVLEVDDSGDGVTITEVRED